MKALSITFIAMTLLLIARASLAQGERSTSGKPLKVCATLPDLGDIARSIGGGNVDVTVFVKGPEDPHFLEAKPSFIKAASEADLFIQSGLELEVGYAPAILANARNEKIAPGATGFLEAASVVTPLDVASGQVDRSMGDVHAGGNPHFLSDPLNGIKVARLIADRLGTLRPEHRADFDASYAKFRERICVGLVGETLAKKYDAEKLAQLFESGRLEGFLESQGDRTLLGGWLGKLSGHAGVGAVADHNLWPYFARRFNIKVVAFLEPKPGVAPTTKHLGEVIEQMKRDHVALILAAPYFDPRHAALVAQRTGAKIVPLSHQVGGREGTGSYYDCIDYNVKQLAAALEGTK